MPTIFNSTLRKENEMLRKENEELRREIEYLNGTIELSRKYLTGEVSHSKDIERAEKFFIKVFKKLHLHLSINDFTNKCLDKVDENNCPNVASGEIPCDDFKVWCLQVAKKKYSQDPEKSIEYAQKLFDFVSKCN